MKCKYACGSMEHVLARRQFLGGAVAATGAVAGGLGWLAQPAAARRLRVFDLEVFFFGTAIVNLKKLAQRGPAKQANITPIWCQ